MFVCDCCGICCKHIKGIKELENFVLDDESCINLDKNTNLCKIYDTRPTICRVDRMYEVEYFKYFNKKEFYELNQKACEKLKEFYKG